MRVLGTLDDDETMVGATDDVAVDVLHPRRGARSRGGRSVCNLLRETEVGGLAPVEVPEDRGAARTAPLLRRAGAMTEPSRPRSPSSPAPAQGLGEAIAARLVADGFRVVFADVNDAARRADGGRRLTRAESKWSRSNSTCASSTRSQACLDVAVERWGRVDVWVNNAARTVARPFLEIDPDEWDDVLATNLRGHVLRLPRRWPPHVRARSGQDRQPRLGRRAVGTKPHRRPLRGIEGGHRRGHAHRGDGVRRRTA